MGQVFTATFLIGSLISFMLGAASSWAFWKYQRYLRPDVRVSPVVLKGPSRREQGCMIYRIKVVNLGHRQVSNIAAAAGICIVSGTPNLDQRRVELRKIELNFSDLPALGGRQSLDEIWGVAPFFIFSFHDDIESLLGPDVRLVFTLTGADAVSGTTVTQRIAYTKDDVKFGDFRRSLDFALSPLVTANGTPQVVDRQS